MRADLYHTLLHHLREASFHHVWPKLQLVVGEQVAQGQHCNSHYLPKHSRAASAVYRFAQHEILTSSCAVGKHMDASAFVVTM